MDEQVKIGVIGAGSAAFALDPMIDDLEVAKKLLDDYLKTFDSYLGFKL